MSKNREPLQQLAYQKSNDFIFAKTNTTLLENKVLAIALTRIETVHNNTNNKDELVANLYPGELVRLLGDKANIYRTLKKMSKTITGQSIVIEDGKGNFNAFALIPNADYVDGVFTIKFNEKIREHIFELSSNFTTLALSMMTSFNRTSSFRLYEILKAELYKLDKKKVDHLVIEYNISELKFMIGLADINDPAVKKAMGGRKVLIDNDWDELFDKLPDDKKTYSDWGNFKKRVLNPAQKELVEKSDLRFEYEGIRQGRSTKKIAFTIYKNVPSNPDVIDERERYIEENIKLNRQYEMPRDLPQFKHIYDEFVGHNEIAAEDIDLFINKADMNGELVIQAINAADMQEELRNYIGWIIRYIERGGYEDMPIINGDRERTKQVIAIKENYEQNKDAIAAKVWTKTKTKDDINEFLASLNFESIEDFELIYDEPDEAYQMYIDWKKISK